MESSDDARAAFVRGQRFAYATAALATGAVAYLSLLGIEKGALAVLFAIVALRKEPGPQLSVGRGRAIAGLALGALMLIAVPLVLVLFRDRVGDLVRALEALQ
jgi:hypothetical protein